MAFKITAELSYTTTAPCALLLQVMAMQGDGQSVTAETLAIAGDPALQRIKGEHGLGERIWLQTDTTFDCRYEATVEVTRPNADLTTLQRDPLIDLPAEATPFLMGSRYCHPEAFFDFTGGALGELHGGAFVVAAADWIRTSFTYDPFASHAGTTAHDSFAARKGVCRDYAHVLIAMCRARAIPARFVSCYGPDVTPQDFHAVAEVYLEGAWHLVDPTGMATPDCITRIGVGRDAADVSFMTSYGGMELKKQAVSVEIV